MTQPFEHVNRPYGDAGAKRAFVVAHCSGCGAEEAISDTHGKGSVPFRIASKVFARKGWEVGNSRSKDVCPSCVRSRRGRRAVPAAPLKGVDGPIPADSGKATTTLGAKLIEAAVALTKEPPMPQAKPPEPNPATVASKIEQIKETPAERILRINKSRTPEERAALARKGAQNRRERLAAEAEIARLAAEQEADARREKKGRGIRQFWANLTPEERSERGKVAAATLAAKRAAEAAGVPFVRPSPMKPAEIAQAKNTLARAVSAAKQPQEPAMSAVAAQPKTADAPRQATREQNQKILEKLHEVYDTSDPENLHYIKTYTDKQVAEELHFPAAWVAAVRDQFFGPEKNEAADVFAKELQELKAKQADLHARVTRNFEELTKLETEMRRTNDALANACRRAGVPIN